MKIYTHIKCTMFDITLLSNMINAAYYIRKINVIKRHCKHSKYEK